MDVKKRIELLKLELECFNRCIEENNLKGAMNLVPQVMSDADKLVKELSNETNTENQN